MAAPGGTVDFSVLRVRSSDMTYIHIKKVKSSYLLNTHSSSPEDYLHNIIHPSLLSCSSAEAG